MRVIIAGSIFRDSSHQAWMLHKLMSYVCEGRHVIHADPSSSLTEWIGMLDQQTRGCYERAIGLTTRTACTQSSTVATVRVENVAQSRWDEPTAVLTLADALVLLNEPLGVLVENSSNDWKFLLGIMGRSERERMQRAVANRWVEPIHGGGSTLGSQLEERLTVNARALRTFVLFDSDRLHPDELLKTWTPERPRGRPSACQAFEWERIVQQRMPLRYWMLRRRFIEAYLPKDELSKGAAEKTHTDAVETFYQMTQHQRWYFNIKNGFDGDAKRHDNERRRELFTEDQTKHPALQRGFGERVADQYSYAIEREFNWDAEARVEAREKIPRLMSLL